MTASDKLPRLSGRRSGRVELTEDVLAGQTATGRSSAPEGYASRPANSAAPERAAGTGNAGTPRRISQHQLHIVRDALSERDRAVLKSMDQHPYLTSVQLQRLHFRDHATCSSAGRICRRTLQRLAEQRVIEHLDRRIGGVRAGSASYVWRVGPTGDRLIREASAAGGRARRKEPSLRHLEHCLAVAETHIRLLEATSSHRLEVLQVQTEPRCWRSYVLAGVARAVLKPDLYTVTANGDFEDHWFIEVDRGTESLPTLLRKCAQYEQYRATGKEQQVSGVFPLVLWLLPDERRVAQLHQAIKRTPALDERLYRLTTPGGLTLTIGGGDS